MAASSSPCFQCQLQDGGTCHVKFPTTTFVYFSEKSKRVTFEGAGKVYDNGTVLEAIVACSDNGYISGSYTPVQEGSEKIVRLPLSALNLQATRAVQSDDVILMAIPAQPAVNFEANEMKERAVLATAAIKCALKAAARIVPHARHAVALKLSGMNLEELMLGCTAENISLETNAVNDQDDLASFAFATLENSCPQNIVKEGTTISYIMSPPEEGTNFGMSPGKKMFKPKYTATQLAAMIGGFVLFVVVVTFAVFIS